jgi:hypothetical protein
MIVLALGALVLALLIGLGRRPLAARTAWRALTLALAAAVTAGALVAAIRGEWLGAVMLIGAAIWVGRSAQSPKTPTPGARELAEAAAMLGVAETASRAEIEAAFRRLMLRVHPDQGGAPGLAVQLNRARDIMLAARR